MERPDSSFPRKIAYGAGFGIGIIWILMAASTLWSAARGISHGRGDWALGWGLVGLCLLIAGVAALVGTWWHQNRVLSATDEHHRSH